MSNLLNACFSSSGSTIGGETVPSVTEALTPISFSSVLIAGDESPGSCFFSSILDIFEKIVMSMCKLYSINKLRGEVDLELLQHFISPRCILLYMHSGKTPASPQIHKVSAYRYEISSQSPGSIDLSWLFIPSLIAGSSPRYEWSWWRPHDSVRRW